ncbi:MAG TPA: isoprenylcysteine carboxylmethyltransferase family protein [Candidatus Limnocylindrales bacterium]|nr:isoprenylcysteine carboxylmethyltransferase family protein [Candidatus Limnocylindrales bacterium]
MAAAAKFWIRWRVRIGYPVALGYLVLAEPSARSLIVGAFVGVAGLAIRAWAAGYLRKHEVLATHGPYAFTRNPLYFGSAILAAGFIVAGDSLWAGVIVAAYLALFYPAVMKREEGELRGLYGDNFARYAARVPLFLPRIWPRKQAEESVARFSPQIYRRNREYQAAIGFLAGLALLWAKMHWMR